MFFKSFRSPPVSAFCPHEIPNPVNVGSPLCHVGCVCFAQVTSHIALKVPEYVFLFSRPPRTTAQYQSATLNLRGGTW